MMLRRIWRLMWIILVVSVCTGLKVRGGEGGGSRYRYPGPDFT